MLPGVRVLDAYVELDTPTIAEAVAEALPKTPTGMSWWCR